MLSCLLLIVLVVQSGGWDSKCAVLHYFFRSSNCDDNSHVTMREQCCARLRIVKRNFSLTPKICARRRVTACIKSACAGHFPKRYIHFEVAHCTADTRLAFKNNGLLHYLFISRIFPDTLSKLIYQVCP